LKLEEIGNAFLEPIRPEVRAGRAINQLRVGALADALLLHGTLSGDEIYSV
jgi:hypothetical protein